MGLLSMHEQQGQGWLQPLSMLCNPCHMGFLAWEGEKSEQRMVRYVFRHTFTFFNRSSPTLCTSFQLLSEHEWCILHNLNRCTPPHGDLWSRWFGLIWPWGWLLIRRRHFPDWGCWQWWRHLCEDRAKYMLCRYTSEYCIVWYVFRHTFTLFQPSTTQADFTTDPHRPAN